jgi:hypothetical protein
MTSCANGSNAEGFFSLGEANMRKFKVVVWCDHCQNDAEGCFAGGTETIGSSFETWDDARKAAEEYCGHFPYGYRVEEEDEY